MAFESLSAFVRALRGAGELATIDVQVDPYLEIAEITDRVVKAGGPALFFRDVRGSRFPVLTNAFGTERRTAMALGARSLADLEARLRATIDLAMPDTFGGKVMRFADLAAAGASVMPRRVSDAPVQQVVMDPPDLHALPVLTTWPLDGGPFVTLPLVFSTSHGGLASTPTRKTPAFWIAWTRGLPVGTASSALTGAAELAMPAAKASASTLLPNDGIKILPVDLLRRLYC